MDIYLDSCCYNRPFDLQDQNVIIRETDAILEITQCARYSQIDLIGSDAIKYELMNIRDSELRAEILTFYRNSVIIEKKLTKEHVDRSASLQACSSLHLLDSIHIAIAESAGVDFFLTTDLRFLRSCKKLQLELNVMNPVDFMKEVKLPHDCT